MYPLLEVSPQNLRFPKNLPERRKTNYLKWSILSSESDHSIYLIFNIWITFLEIRLCLPYETLQKAEAISSFAHLSATSTKLAAVCGTQPSQPIRPHHPRHWAHWPWWKDAGTVDTANLSHDHHGSEGCASWGLAASSSTGLLLFLPNYQA